MILQRRVTVDGAVKAQTKTIVIRGRGQYFNLIVDVLDALNSLYYVLGIRLQSWTGDLSHESDVVSIYFVRDVIEYAEVRQHQQLVPDFLCNPLSGSRGGLSGLLA